VHKNGTALKEARKAKGVSGWKSAKLSPETHRRLKGYAEENAFPTLSAAVQSLLEGAKWTTRMSEPRAADNAISAPQAKGAPQEGVNAAIRALDDDMNWVRQNVDRLTEERGLVYLAVKNHEVIDADADKGLLVMRLYRERGRQAFLVVYLGDPRLRREKEPPEIEPGVIEEDLA